MQSDFEDISMSGIITLYFNMKELKNHPPAPSSYGIEFHYLIGMFDEFQYNFFQYNMLQYNFLLYNL